MYGNTIELKIFDDRIVLKYKVYHLYDGYIEYKVIEFKTLNDAFNFLKDKINTKKFTILDERM